MHGTSAWRTRVVLAFAAAAVFICPPWPPGAAASAAPADPLGCAATVFDPAGVATPALEAAAVALAEQFGATVHVRIEGSLDGTIDARQQLLETSCPSWLGADGLRAAGLLVVMVSPSERQTAIYYGSDFGDALPAADPQIQAFVMNPRFEDGDIEGGLIDGLAAIGVAVSGGGVPQARPPTYDGSTFTIPSTPPYTRSESFSSTGGSDGLPVAGIVVLILLVVAVSAFGQYAKGQGWTTTSSSSGYRRSWSSSSRSSSRSFGSSSSRHSSGGSSSRRRSGGGSSSSW